MGEQDWIISQNRSIGFANNPYKFMDKGGNRVAYTEESGGSSPPQNVCKVPPPSKNVGNSSINGASIVKNGAFSAYNNYMKNYFGSYPEDMIRDIDNKLNEWATTSAEWSVKLGALASVLSISASQTWMIPGWGGTIVTTTLIVSVAAAISGVAGMIFSVFQGITGHNEKGLDGKKLSKEESEFRKNAALSNGFESALGMILGGSSWVSGSNSQTNINNSKNEGASGVGTSLKKASSSVGSKLNGTVSELNNGYKIEIPNGNKPIVVRIMDEGSGGRSAPYFRVSIDGKGSLTLDGVLSSDRALTHIDLTDNYLEQITNMVTKYKGGK